MIELDVISGFLGAGKTTLANALLSNYMKSGERAVYIVNEFGETETDADLLRSEGFTAVTLPNGCICCTLRTDLTLALYDVIQKLDPTKIVFETSGIFIYDQFESILKDEFLSKHCRIRRTVAVVDSLNFQRRAVLAGSFIENQMKNSSVIVISKLERFSGDVDELVCDVKAIAPDAALIARRWDEDGFIKDLLTADGNHAWVSGHGHAHLDTATVAVEKDMAQNDYERFIETLLSGREGEFLRVKGAIRIDGHARRLDLSMNDVVLRPAREHEPLRLTFIGHGFNPVSITSLLQG
jgi:G3E family GTPase